MNYYSAVVLIVLAAACLGSPDMPAHAKNIGDSLMVITTDQNGNPVPGGGAGDGAIVDGAAPSVKATVKDYVNSNPLAIIPVDTNGDPASLSGGTQYDQGTASADTDKLMLMGCVRADSAAAATGVVNGDRARCIVDANNKIWVQTGTVTIANANMESYLSRLLSSALTAPNGGAPAATTGFIVGGRYLSTPPTLTNGQEVGLMFSSTGSLKVEDGSPTGVPADGMSLVAMKKVLAVNGCYNGTTVDLCRKGSSGAGPVDATTARTSEATDSQLSVDVAAIKAAAQLIANDQTGTSNNHHVSVGVTEDETEIKASAGRLMAVQVSNSAATAAYLRCANLTAANTTPGTSTVFWGMAVPGNTAGAGLTAVIGGPSGLAFSTALTCWVVTGKAESDVAEVGANDVQWNIQYK